LIREVGDRHGLLEEGDLWYVVSLRWWDLWRKYTGYDFEPEAPQALVRRTSSRRLGGTATGACPPAIDNECLVVRPDSERLQRGLQEYTDFVLLHKDAWDLLFAWYGGGPAVQRRVIRIGGGASAELRVELYPLWLTVFRCDFGGYPDKQGANEVTCSRSRSVQSLLDDACELWGIADKSEESVRLWHRSNVEVDQTDVDETEGWERLQPPSKTLDQLSVVDGASLLLEQSKQSAQGQGSKTVTEWPFFTRMRIDYKNQKFKNPQDPACRLCIDDVLDASVEATKRVWSYLSLTYETQMVETWHQATVVAEDEERVLLQFHDREKPKKKLPPILTGGSVFGSKEFTADAKAGLALVFKRYASNGKIDRGGLRGMISCATNAVVGEHSTEVSDLLRTYGDSSTVDYEGFERYWREQARSNSYWLEEELTRLFDRAGFGFEQSEEDKLLAQGREWIPRSSPRLAQYHSHAHAHGVSQHFRDFRKYSSLDANFGGEWKQVQVVEVNWETMAVLVQVKDAGSFYNPRFKASRDWIPMESERLAEYKTKSLEEPDDPARLLARSKSQGGVCERPGICGLQNLGNTCFMNATLQCLSNCVELRAFFVGQGGGTAPFLSQLSSSPLSMQGRLAKEFSKCLCSLWSNSLTYYAPAKLKTLIGEKRPEFSGYQQHDAQELLTFLLDGLHEDVNRAPHPRPFVPDVEADGRPDSEVAEEAWQGHLKRNDSALVEMFQFQIRSEVQCPVCNCTSVRFDPSMYLSLPVPKPPHAVELSVLPSNFPCSAMLKLSVVIDKEAPFSELEAAVRAQLDTGIGTQPSCFVFADVWGDRVVKMFQGEDSVSTIKPYDCVYALEVELDPNLPEEQHTFLPVLFRKQQPSLYERFSSRLSYSRVAPPRIIAVPEGQDNAGVHRVLSAMGNALLSLAGAGCDFEVVQDIDAYGIDAGKALQDNSEKFEARQQQHLGINFGDAGAIASLQERLCGLSAQDAVASGGAGGCGTSVQECLQKHAEREQLSEMDEVYCSTCKEHRRSWKKLDLWTAPQHLVLHLKRFGRDRITGPMEKITSPVAAPPTLPLSPLAGPEGGCSYDLYGVVEHSGALAGGHYTARCLVTSIEDADEGVWYKFNDQYVDKVSRDSIDPQAAYIMFYRRRA